MNAPAPEYTADMITRGIAFAIEARDFPAVVSLLKLLAAVDPVQAQVVYDAMTAVLDMRQAGEDRSDT